MELATAIRERRAVKHYDPDHKISDEEIDQIIDLAIQAPTSFNIQHWRFVNVKDTSKRAELQKAAWDQAQVTEASAVFVICGDLLAWDKDPARYWKDAPQAAQDILVPMIQPFYEGREWIQRDEVMRSIGFAAQNMMLAAKSMGYDSCPMIGFDQDEVAKIINLPEDYAIGMILSIGKAIKPAWPKPGQLPMSDVLIEDTF